MNDLALGVIVATLAAVPLSLLILAVTDVIHLPEGGCRQRWMNRCLAGLSLPLIVTFGVLVWGWAGASDRCARPMHSPSSAMKLRWACVPSRSIQIRARSPRGQAHC